MDSRGRHCAEQRLSVNSKSLRRSHYKSESVNESSTTCLSYCYIQTDITAVLPPGWGVLHILLVFYCVVSAKEKIELHVFYAMQCKTLQCCQSVCLVCRWNPV